MNTDPNRVGDWKLSIDQAFDLAVSANNMGIVTANVYVEATNVSGNTVSGNTEISIEKAVIQGAYVYEHTDTGEKKLGIVQKVFRWRNVLVEL